MIPLCIETHRGEGVESVHRVSVAVVDADGRHVAWAGDPDLSVFLRSAAKPFQAMPLVADGAAERFHVTSEELALACASHNSERGQVAIVARFLQRIGCSEEDLACGPHRALALDMAIRVPGEPEPALASPGALASNCSGKHTGMLALAKHHGWPIEGYHRAEHPVQRRCRTELAQWCDVPEGQIGQAVDGCGVVCFQIPLVAMALAYARLGRSDGPSARAVREAMVRHPNLVAGAGRLCTAAMSAYPGRLVTKVGAEGVYGAALPASGLGIALKVEDGHNRAAMIALIAVLEQLRLTPSAGAQLARFAASPVENTRGETVGVMRAVGALTFV